MWIHLTFSNYKTIVFLNCLLIKTNFVTRLISVIIILLFSFTAFPQLESRKALFKAENGKVSFISDAPLEMIKAESNAMTGLIDPEKRTFAFQVETKTLNGFNSPLQEEHFYENYIESDKYPTATFSGKIIENVDFDKPGDIIIRAKGVLDIHGEKMERIIKCQLVSQPNGFLARSTFTVSLADHNISIPKLVYQKIAEEVQVLIEVEFQKIVHEE